MPKIVVWVRGTSVGNAPVSALCAWNTATVEHPTKLGQRVRGEVKGALWETNRYVSMQNWASLIASGANWPERRLCLNNMALRVMAAARAAGV